MRAWSRLGRLAVGRHAGGASGGWGARAGGVRGGEQRRGAGGARSALPSSCLRQLSERSAIARSEFCRTPASRAAQAQSGPQGPTTPSPPARAPQPPLGAPCVAGGDPRSVPPRGTHPALGRPRGGCALGSGASCVEGRLSGGRGPGGVVSRVGGDVHAGSMGAGGPSARGPCWWCEWGLRRAGGWRSGWRAAQGGRRRAQRASKLMLAAAV